MLGNLGNGRRPYLLASSFKADRYAPAYSTHQTTLPYCPLAESDKEVRFEKRTLSAFKGYLQQTFK